MLELVFAPCSPLAGGNVNWIAKTDEEIIDAVSPKQGSACAFSSLVAMLLLGKCL